MFPRLFSFGNFTLHSYGALLALGVFLGYTLALGSARFRSLSGEFISSAVTGAVISGVVAARLAYVLLYISDFAREPLRIFMFWEGGLVFWGGLAGGAAWVIYACLRRGFSVPAAGDVLAPSVALGHAFGRIGCFLAGCCWGAHTDSFLGMTFSHPETLCTAHGPVHPVQLYSAGFLFLLAAALYRRLVKPYSGIGSVLGLYLFSYSLFPFFIEFLRGDYRGEIFLSFTPTQWVAILGCAVGAAILRKTFKSG